MKKKRVGRGNKWLRKSGQTCDQNATKKKKREIIGKRVASPKECFPHLDLSESGHKKF